MLFQPLEVIIKGHDSFFLFQFKNYVVVLNLWGRSVFYPLSFGAHRAHTVGVF